MKICCQCRKKEKKKVQIIVEKPRKISSKLNQDKMQYKQGKIKGLSLYQLCQVLNFIS